MSRGKEYLDQKVLKKFEDGFFEGKVVSIEEEAVETSESTDKTETSKKPSTKKRLLFNIKYEDGDEEDVYVGELKKLIKAYEADQELKKEAEKVRAEFVGKSVLRSYKKKPLKGVIDSAKLKTKYNSSLVFTVKLENDKLIALTEDDVRLGVKYFDFEQVQQESLKRQRSQIIGTEVAKRFEGKMFKGTVVAVEREEDKPITSGPTIRSKFLYHIKYEDGDEEDVDLQELRALKNEAKILPELQAAEDKYKGTKITKIFDEQAFDGEVECVYLESKRRKNKTSGPVFLYHVKFSDGDEEDLYEADVVAGAALFKKEPAEEWNKRPASKRKAAEPKKKPAAKKRKKAAKPKKPTAKPTRVSARTAQKKSS